MARALGCCLTKTDSGCVAKLPESSLYMDVACFDRSPIFGTTCSLELRTLWSKSLSLSRTFARDAGRFVRSAPNLGWGSGSSFISPKKESAPSCLHHRFLLPLEAKVVLA